MNGSGLLITFLMGRNGKQVLTIRHSAGCITYSRPVSGSDFMKSWEGKERLIDWR